MLVLVIISNSMKWKEPILCSLQGKVVEIMRQQKNDINENTVKANNLLFVILTELRIA